MEKNQRGELVPAFICGRRVGWSDSDLLMDSGWERECNSPGLRWYSRVG